MDSASVTGFDVVVIVVCCVASDAKETSNSNLSVQSVENVAWKPAESASSSKCGLDQIGKYYVSCGFLLFRLS